MQPREHGRRCLRDVAPHAGQRPLVAHDHCMRGRRQQSRRGPVQGAARADPAGAAMPHADAP
eukprot:5784974-Pyramimonas_sp.AAC.1